jgi:hypothetical protein
MRRRRARWRFVFRQSDGRLTSRRGFTSRSVAAAARAIAVEEVRRGDVRAIRDTFGEFWAKVLSGPSLPPSRTDGIRPAFAAS